MAILRRTEKAMSRAICKVKLNEKGSQELTSLLGLKKSGSPFRTSHDCKLPTGSLTNKADCHWWAPKNRHLRNAG